MHHSFERDIILMEEILKDVKKYAERGHSAAAAALLKVLMEGLISLNKPSINNSGKGCPAIWTKDTQSIMIWTKHNLKQNGVTIP